MALIDLANPTRFRALVDGVLPWLGAATVVAFAFALEQDFFAPDDYQQGATVKIMFIHVPAAWLSMMAWGMMSLAALGTLVWRHPLADVAAKTAAPLGAAFTLLCLVTGSLWGRPMWGTYWVWDARLTSELVLFLMYLGVIGAALATALRRGGLLLPVLVLPLTIPVLIFGVAATNAAVVGPMRFDTPFTILCALTLMSAVVGPFAAAATLRYGME